MVLTPGQAPGNITLRSRFASLSGSFSTFTNFVYYMSTKLNVVLKALALTLLSSCVIAINENNYRLLTPESKKHIRPFTMDLLNRNQNYKDSIFIYEISSRDIRQIIKKHKYTWIHFWAPWCSNKSCINVVGIMDEVKEMQKGKDFVELLVAREYDLDDIRSRLKNTDFTQPVLILSDSIYGHKQARGIRLFASEIDNNSLLKKNGFFSEYLFCDTILKVAAMNLTPQQIDRVVNYKKIVP
jgi:hypothetical protein